jgi:hypothetical protein
VFFPEQSLKGRSGSFWLLIFLQTSQPLLGGPFARGVEKAVKPIIFSIMMKISLLFRVLATAAVGTVLVFGASAYGEDSDMLNQALDLVHQAWNPGGDPPSDADRTQLLNKALTLAQNAPEHRVRGHRVQAILDIKAALALIKDGDADHKATEMIHDAADQLRDALTIAQ